MDLHERYGLTRIVNGLGKATILANAQVPPDVIEVVSASLRHSFDADELQRAAGREIAEFSGAEAGFVTASCAAGITLSVAACMTGRDAGKVAQLPDTEGMTREVIIQKGHAMNFGAPVTQMARLAGARVREVGTVNGTSPEDLESAIGPETAAILFVVSQYALPRCVPLPEVVRIAHAHGVPVVVDAAAQEFLLRDIVATGADLVTCSGHKYLAGTVSGLVCGRRELIDAVALQNQGIGRPMKVGKEGIFGLLAALDSHRRLDVAAFYRRIEERVDHLCGVLGDVPGVRAEKTNDPTGNPWTRARISIDPQVVELDAATVCRTAARHDPAVVLRQYHAAEGYFEIEVIELTSEEMEIVEDTLRRILNAASETKASWRDAEPVDPRFSWLGHDTPEWTMTMASGSRGERTEQ